MVYSPEPDCSIGDPRCEVSSNGRALEEEAKNTGFVREIYFQIEAGQGEWLKVRTGKMLVSTGNGFIMDNYSLGTELIADLDEGFEVPLKITIDGLFPNGDFPRAGKRSPYVYLDIAYLMSFFEEIGLFFGFYHDGNHNVGEMLGNWLMDLAGFWGSYLTGVESNGNLFWIGARANWIFDRASLSGTGIIQFGNYDVAINGVRIFSLEPFRVEGTPSSFGGMFDCSFYYDLTDSITLGTFFLYLSGEKKTTLEGTLNGEYRSYLSIYPYITRTNLFFSGGMNENYSARSFSTAGVNARGVLAPGITVGFDLTDDITIRLVSALLYSDGTNTQSNSNFYGWESDFNFEWNLHKHIRLLFEADYFWTGGFFDFPKPLETARNQRNFEEEPSSWKILLGVDLFY